MKTYFLVILLVTSVLHAEVTTMDYNVDTAAIVNGPVRNISEQNLCNGVEPMSVSADQGRQSVQTCEMSLNPFFAQLLKAFIPKCAKEAAIKNGMSLPTSVSIEHMGGYANRNARNSSRASRHSLGMALDLSMIQLNYRDLFGRERNQRIPLVRGTSNQPFYDSFRSCWDAAVARSTGGSCTCSIGHSHTHEPSNHLHDDHMHISLSCPQGNAVRCSLEKETPTIALVQ